MKKITLFFFSLLLIAATGYAEELALINQTIHPMKDQKSMIAIQWATSAKEVDEGNHAVTHGLKLNPNTLQFLTQPGKVKFNIPKKAEYFRVLVWSNGEGDPDFLTNWVDIVPNKTYTLKTDHLVPSVLMSGMGC